MPRDNKVPYPIMAPFMDAGSHPSKMAEGVPSKAVGVDGRYRGCARPFPGFVLYTDLSTIKVGVNQGAAIGTIQYLSFFKWFSIQRETTGAQIEGFVIRFGSPLTGQTIALCFFDTVGAEWRWLNVTTVAGWANVSNAMAMGIATSGRFLYITLETKAPIVLWYDSGADNEFQLKVMGCPSALVTLPAAVAGDGEAGAGGRLKYDGTYAFAFRFRDSVRNVYSGMSSLLVRTMTTAGNTGVYGILIDPAGGGWPAAYDTWAEIEAVFDTIEFFRTIDASVAEGHYTGGVLYKEAEAVLTTFDDTNKVNLGTMRDEDLAVQTRYDPEEDIVSAAPEAGVTGVYQGVTVVSLDPNDASGSAGLAYTTTTKTALENFSTSRYYRRPQAEGEVHTLLEVGDVLYAFTPNVIYRVEKGGGLIIIGRFHLGRSLRAPDLAHVVGRDVVMLTKLGLCVMDGTTADIKVISAADRILYGEAWPTSGGMHPWLGQIGNVPLAIGSQNSYMWSGQGCCAYDSNIGASIFGNMYNKEAIILWHSSWGITMLVDWPYVAASAGPDKAYFVTDSGKVGFCAGPGYAPRMMIPHSTTATFNGTATTGTTTTSLVCATGLFGTDVIGGELYVKSAAGTWAHGTITARPSATVLTVAAISGLASGAAFAVSPVVFELRLWPLGANDPRSAAFERRKVDGMGVSACGFAFAGLTDGVSGTLSNTPNAEFIVGVYRNSGIVAANSALIDMDVDPPDSFAYFTADGTLVEPFVRVICAGVDFQLTDVEVDVTMSRTREHS